MNPGTSRAAAHVEHAATGRQLERLAYPGEFLPMPRALDRRAIAHDLVVIARRDLAVVEGRSVAMVMAMARFLGMGVPGLVRVLLDSVGHDGAQSRIAL